VTHEEIWRELEANPPAENGTGKLSGAVTVTPAMVEAARMVLWESGRLRSEADGPDDLLVEDMIRAALNVL
jgi:uncharacterized transporter YbjL